MKNIFSMYALRLKIILKSAVLVIPTVSVCAFLGIMYSFVPVEVSGSFLISAFFLFVLSAYISMSIQGKENDVHEEIMILHSDSEFHYYISRELIIYSLSLVYALILISYPVIKYALKSNLFSRPLTRSDILFGGIIVIGSGCCGAALGDFFHRRIFTTRRNGIIGLILISVLAVCKQPLIKEFSPFKILDVIVPPIMDGFNMVGNSDRFSGFGSLQIFLHMTLYVMIVAIIKIRILKYKKF